MQPVQISSLGTAISTPVIFDIKQNPFNIGIGVSVVTGGIATAGLSIEHTFDFSTVMSPTWNGTTAVWFPNTGINATTVTTNIGINGNYAFPVAAIRLNVLTATATTLVVANLLQATNSP